MVPCGDAAAARGEYAGLALVGSLIVVPVANPTAFELALRNIPDASDSPDVNRSMPGEHLWRAEQYAGALSREVLPLTSHLIDLHTGMWGVAFQDVLLGEDLPGPAAAEPAHGGRARLASGSAR